MSFSLSRSSTSSVSSPGGSAPGTPTASGGNANTGLITPELINKFEAGSDDINAAVLIPGQEQGVMTASSDR